MPTDDLAQILGISISENLELFHAINTLCISYHNGRVSGKINPPQVLLSATPAILTCQELFGKK